MIEATGAPRPDDPSTVPTSRAKFEWGVPEPGRLLIGRDVEPRLGLLVNHAFADKGVGVITWLSFGCDVGNCPTLALQLACARGG